MMIIRFEFGSTFERAERDGSLGLIGLHVPWQARSFPGWHSREERVVIGRFSILQSGTASQTAQAQPTVGSAHRLCSISFFTIFLDRIFVVFSNFFRRASRYIHNNYYYHHQLYHHVYWRLQRYVTASVVVVVVD